MGNEAGTTAVVFGRRVREERIRRNWRLADLAAAAATCGLERHLSYFAKVERADTEPRLGEAVAIAEALGQPLSAMLTASAGEIAARAARLTSLAVADAEQANDLMTRAARRLSEAQELARTQGGS